MWASLTRVFNANTTSAVRIDGVTRLVWCESGVQLAWLHTCPDLFLPPVDQRSLSRLIRAFGLQMFSDLVFGDGVAFLDKILEPPPNFIHLAGNKRKLVVLFPYLG